MRPLDMVLAAVWNSLFQRCSTGAVAPFALLASCTGVVSSAVALGEIFSPVRYAGMALILVGLAVVVLPGPPAR
jgi:O-acetylserine/cysteine efflux transporter